MDNQIDHQKLSAWLHESQLDRAMTNATDIPPAGASDAALLPPAAPEAIESEQVCFQSGDVLLLKPLTPLTRSRPVYVVVWKKSDAAGRCQVVPFARFASPATPGEVLSGLESPPLRVLCWWNRRMVSAAWLQASTWRICRLVPALVPTLFMDGDERRGPRLVHPLDPRHAYLDTERELWEELAPTLARWQYTNGASNQKSVTGTGWEQARAAEAPDDEYGDGPET